MLEDSWGRADGASKRIKQSPLQAIVQQWTAFPPWLLIRIPWDNSDWSVCAGPATLEFCNTSPRLECIARAESCFSEVSDPSQNWKAEDPECDGGRNKSHLWEWVEAFMRVMNITPLLLWDLLCVKTYMCSKERGPAPRPRFGKKRYPETDLTRCFVFGLQKGAKRKCQRSPEGRSCAVNGSREQHSWGRVCRGLGVVDCARSDVLDEGTSLPRCPAKDRK